MKEEREHQTSYIDEPVESPSRVREKVAASGRERRALCLARRWQKIALIGIAAALLLLGVLLVVLFAAGGESATAPLPGESAGSAANGGGNGGTDPSSGKENAVPVICIDPGHGFTKSSGLLDVGCDTGAYRDMTGKYEADLNLEISLLLRTELEKRGYTVVMTREKNEEKVLEISERPGYIDSLQPDLCISIHGNSFDGSVTGTRVFVNNNRSDCDPFGKALVQAINDARAQYPALTSPAASLKKDTTSIAVLRAVSCPVALVETCFIDAELDAVKAASPLWQAQMASALADGIEAFLPLPK